MKLHELTVCGDAARIDTFLAQEIAGLSRSMAHKLILEGCALVNNMPVKPSHKLKPGDNVTVDLPDSELSSAVAQDIPLDILFEDQDIIVVNKPRGMVVHPASGHYEDTLVNALLFHCADNLSGINGVLRPGIVHRIDKDTSGLLVVAKNDLSHRFLAMQLAAHEMKRIYIAIANGIIEPDTGVIDKPIARHPSDRKKMAIVSNGKRAVTHFKVLRRFARHMLIEAKLETGRTHQIRVHMASIGHPLLGDPVYGRAEGADGQALHSGTIGFIHPSTGQYMEFFAEPPFYFENLLGSL